MSTKIFRGKLATLLQGRSGRGKKGRGVPSKISEMELAAHDTVAYDEDEDEECNSKGIEQEVNPGMCGM